MLESIVSYGLARRSGLRPDRITYIRDVHRLARFSFTAGMLGMLGGVLGALFITKLGLPAIVSFVLRACVRRRIGVVTKSSPLRRC